MYSLTDNKTSENLVEFPHPHSPVGGENLWLFGPGESRGIDVAFMFQVRINYNT